MATNYVQDGNVLTLTAPYTRTSGQGAIINSNIFGIALGDITSGADGEWGITGVWDIAASLGEAFSQGSNVYWNDTDRKAEASSTGTNYLIGVATQAKTGGTGLTVRTRLNGVSV